MCSARLPLQAARCCESAESSCVRAASTERGSGGAQGECGENLVVRPCLLRARLLIRPSHARRRVRKRRVFGDRCAPCSARRSSRWASRRWRPTSSSSPPSGTSTLSSSRS
eukprot:2484137-Pleurochrysis_carterae.AAC.1